MVKSLVTFIVRLFNLVEAEARSAKEHAMRLGLSLALVVSAVAIAVGAVALFMAAIAVALSEVMHVGWALAIVGVLLLIVAAVFGLVARSVFNRKRRRQA